MSITIGLKNWLNISESNESLMLKYADTSEIKYVKELVKRLEHDLYHFLYSQAGPDLAADISQIAWEKLIKNRRSYSDTGTVKSWLFKIARFALIDELRKQSRWQLEPLDNHQAELLPDTTSEQYTVMANSELKKHFDQAFAALPFLQREAFILQQEGFRLREIAQITQSDIETIKSRLRYAKHTLTTLVATTAEGA